MSTIIATPDTAGMVDLDDLYTVNQLKTMGEEVRLLSHASVRTSEDAEGRTLREAWSLQILPDDDYPVFRIRLYEGSTPDDLRTARDTLRDIRARVHVGPCWVRLTDGLLAFRYNCRVETPSLELPMIPCRDSACIDDAHDAEYDDHRALVIDRELNGDVKYSIDVRRSVYPTDDEDRGWYVDVYTIEFFGSTADVAAFSADLQTASELCERLRAGEALAA